VLFSDGGGVVQAARKPIHGAEKVLRFFAGLATKYGIPRFELTSVNRAPGMLIYFGEEVDGVVTLHVEDGMVTGLYYVRNPSKLSGVAEQVHLER